MWFYIYICIQWSLSSLSDKVWSIGKGVFFGLWLFPCLGGTKVTWTCLFRLLPGSSALFCFLCLIFCNNWVLNTAAVVILKSAIPVPHFLLYWGIIDTQLMPPPPTKGRETKPRNLRVFNVHNLASFNYFILTENYFRHSNAFALPHNCGMFLSICIYKDSR